MDSIFFKKESRMQAMIMLITLEVVVAQWVELRIRQALTIHQDEIIGKAKKK